MAKKKTGLEGIDAAESKIFMLKPSDIIAIQGDNSRAEEHTEDSIKAMAKSLRQTKQLHPITIKPNPAGEGKPVVVIGYRRHAAGLLIEQTRPTFRLACIMRNFKDEEDAFCASIAENAQRKNTTPFDDARNIKKLIDSVADGGFGLTQAEAARRMSKSPSWVNRNYKLLSLPQEVQDKAIERDLSLNAASILVNAPEKLITEFLANKSKKKLTSFAQLQSRRDELVLQAEEEAEKKAESAGSATKEKDTETETKTEMDTDAGNGKKPKKGRPASTTITIKAIQAYVHSLVEGYENHSFLHEFGVITGKMVAKTLSTKGYTRRLISLVNDHVGEDLAMPDEDDISYSGDTEEAATTTEEKTPVKESPRKKAAKKAPRKKAAKKAVKQDKEENANDEQEF